MSNSQLETCSTQDEKEMPLNKHFEELLETIEHTDVSLDFLVPFLADKDEALVMDALKHLKRYADKIPPDSILGINLQMERGLYPPQYAMIEEVTAHGNMSATAQEIDPLVEVGRKHTHALNQWLIAAEKVDDWDDDPDCEYWQKERCKYMDILHTTKARSVAGIRAQLDMIENEFGGNGFPTMDVDAEVFANIRATVKELAA